MSINNNSISPDNFNLYQNYPNPFNSNTKIKLDIKNKSNIELDIYDLSGKIIKQVFRGSKEVGTHIFSWNSKNSMSVKVTSGVYILKLKVENSQIIKKMVLLK
jgi:flagellar hook assembly protein FlgD